MEIILWLYEVNQSTTYIEETASPTPIKGVFTPTFSPP